jgi:branched-chain amino acid transport system permease protein
VSDTARQEPTDPGLAHRLRSDWRIASAGWLLLAIIGVIFPLVQPPHIVALATLGLAYAVAIVGLNMLTGFAGQVSLAQSLFVATGAYITAILVQRYNWPFLATLPPVMLITFVLGLLVGAPAVRLSGLYLAVVTFSLGLLVPPIIIRLEPWTAGANGMPISKKMVPTGIFAADQWKYYIAFAFTCAAFYFVRNIQRGGLGRALVIMRSNPLVAATMGVNAARLKVLAFAWSALLAGVSGSLIALVDQFVAPQTFTFMLSILLLVGAVIGGIHSIVGALIGGLVLVILPQLTDRAGLGWVGVIYGAAVVAFIMVAPNGITGLARSAFDNLLQRLAKRPSAPPPELQPGGDSQQGIR